MAAKADYLTTAQAAARLGLTRRTVARHCEAGRLSCLRVGRDYLILPADLDGYEPPPGAKRGPKPGRRRTRPKT